MSFKLSESASNDNLTAVDELIGMMDVFDTYSEFREWLDENIIRLTIQSKIESMSEKEVYFCFQPLLIK